MALTRYVTVQANQFALTGLSSMQVVRGIPIERATEALVNGTKAIFTVVGRVYLMDLIGEVVGACDGVATNLKIQANPTATGASVDLCANVALAATTAATMFSLSGTPGDAFPKGLAVAGMAKPWILQAGTIDYVTDALNAGTFKWTCVYLPMTDTAQVVAA